LVACGTDYVEKRSNARPACLPNGGWRLILKLKKVFSKEVVARNALMRMKNDDDLPSNYLVGHLLGPRTVEISSSSSISYDPSSLQYRRNRTQLKPTIFYLASPMRFPINGRLQILWFLTVCTTIQISLSLRLGNDPNDRGLFAATRTISSSTSATDARSSPSSSSSLAISAPPPPPPPPPWKFQASRVYYQFRAIPTKQSRKYCPPAAACSTTTTSYSTLSLSQPWKSTVMDSSVSPLILLSVAGFTLGGIFCIEYKDSPIGPYREVAILSSLVATTGRYHPSSSSSFLTLPSIGAWTSHIFVDSEDAASYGVRYWGLPAKVLAIDFKPDGNDNVGAARTSTGSNVMFSNQGIEVSGWNCVENVTGLSKTKSWLTSEWIDLSLPSFSGCLPVEGGGGGGGGGGTNSNPLLQYPLRIRHPRSIALVENGDIRFTEFSNDQGTACAIAEVKELLTNSHPLFSVAVGPVQLEAGRTTTLRGS
jgi:hypothetical protein